MSTLIDKRITRLEKRVCCLEQSPGGGGGGGIVSVVGGTDIEVDDTDPANPIINYTGSGGTYTSSNGITLSGSDFQLGGDVIQTTDLDIINDGDFLNVTGINTDNFVGVLNVVNTGVGGLAFRVANTQGTGAVISSANGAGATISGTNGALGVFASSGQGIAIVTNDNVLIEGERVAASANSVLPLVLVKRTTSGTAANGIGGSIDFNVMNSVAGLPNSNSIVSKLTSAVGGSNTSELSITGLSAGVSSTLLALAGTGQARLHKYGINTFAGTPAFMLGVDASGNIVEVPV